MSDPSSIPDSSVLAGFAASGGPRPPSSAPHPASKSPPASGAAHWRANLNATLEPGLYVVATPIGNLRDITLRALDVLAGADRIYAEDTRVAAKLTGAYGIDTPLSPYHDHNAATARIEILQRLRDGARIALISDAGTPLISDPGFKLVREAVAENIPVIPLPGASALLAALVPAGLPTDRFLFAGFPPPRAAARSALFAELASLRATLVFYETGPRLAESLRAMAGAFGTRQGAVARELTKLYEEVRRGALEDLAAHYESAGPPKGELVVLVGPSGEEEISDTQLDQFLVDALRTQSVKEAAAAAADLLGAPRKRAYTRALALKNSGS